MPTVGKKEFTYDDAGLDAAAKRSEETGEPVVHGYKEGGEVAVQVKGFGAIVNK
jgi:hypothetical protein|tara:strand:- start:129 stop:290 length:162 start_codon:yes stop_codon:yes gene_type:complete